MSNIKLENTIVVSVSAQNKDDIIINPYWFGVQVAKNRLEYLHYIAFYQKAPISKIVYYGEFANIPKTDENDNNKYKFFINQLKELEFPISYNKEQKGYSVQGRIYTSFDKLMNSKSIKDLK